MLSIEQKLLGVNHNEILNSNLRQSADSPEIIRFFLSLIKRNDWYAISDFFYDLLLSLLQSHLSLWFFPH